MQYTMTLNCKGRVVLVLRLRLKPQQQLALKIIRARITMDKIPVINCSEVSGKFETTSIQSLQNFAAQFGSALHDIGFVYLVHHGIDMAKVNKIYELSRIFFDLPADVKKKYRKLEPLKCFNGYSGPGDEFLNEEAKNSIELKELWDVWGEAGYKSEEYPSEVPGFQTAFEDFRIDCINLTWKLLRSLGIYLDLADPDFFLQHHRGLSEPTVQTQTQIRSLYYFPINERIPANSVRCGAHSDWGTVTLLFQDMVGGLEVQNADGEWIQATPIENSVLINTGQLLEFWSGGRLPATPHRVRIQDEERGLKTPRQSIIYFVDPDGDTKVEPITSIVPGREDLASKAPLIAYAHSQRLIEGVMSY